MNVPEGAHPGPAFEDPLSAEIQAFLALAVKSAKGIRVYAANNEMLRRHMEATHAALAGILEKTSEVALVVREDRLLYGRDAVHVNADRDEGLPFILYRSAFRRIAFVRGISRDELTSFLAAVAADYTTYEHAGEDLVTALWRRSLPHLRYLTIDALAFDAKHAASDAERAELERLQNDIESIVARLYRTNAADEDIVPGASITKEDLDALKEIRDEDREDFDVLDVATERALGHIDPADIALMRETLAAETPEVLSGKLLDILIIVLFKEQSSKEFGQTMDLIQQLFDVLLVEARYEEAKALVTRVLAKVEQSEDVREKHIGQHLLRVFSAESRVLSVLNAFNDYQSRSVGDVLDFLRRLGPSIVPHLIGGLNGLTSPAHRRRVVELILEHGIPEQPLLLGHMRNAESLFARDILQLAHGLPESELAPLVSLGLKHENPRVREYAVGLLRPFPPGPADRLNAERLEDSDLDVRLAAIRIAGLRRSEEGRSAFEALLVKEDFADRDPKEQRSMTAAYAQVAGADAVPVLEKVLAPSLFGRPRTTDAQIAAAYALASIGTPAAVGVLQRGMRTLNPKVREACKRALGREAEKTSTADIVEGVKPPEGEDG